eukprot:365699-Chlamydomonas_euryale.AAC.5
MRPVVSPALSLTLTLTLTHSLSLTPLPFCPSAFPRHQPSNGRQPLDVMHMTALALPLLFYSRPCAPDPFPAPVHLPAARCRPQTAGSPRA